MFRFRAHWIFVTLLFFWAAAAGALELDDFLRIDRFQFYLTQLSTQLRSHDKPELADALDKLTPEELLKWDGPRLNNVKKFDDVAIEILKKKLGADKVKPADVRWEYNFLKNKIGAAFKVEDVDASPERLDPELSAMTPETETARVPLADRDLTLNGDQYISERTTRAIFWDAITNKKKIEVHLGSDQDFFDNVARRNGKIVGEVDTFSRSYNRVFLIQYPGEKEPVYALKGVRGGDRMSHTMKSIGLIRWKGKSVSEIRGLVSVVGDAEQIAAREEERVVAQLENLPPAERVIIGQKGAITRAFDTAAKANAVIEAYEKTPKKIEALLEPSELKKLEAARDAGSMFSTLKDAPTWDKVYERLADKGVKLAEVSRNGYQAMSIANEGFDVTDLVFENRNGDPVRWRLISNVWGDEIRPIAKGLKASGAKSIVYIGTAGALPGSGFEIGDLVAPSHAESPAGKKLPIRDPADFKRKGFLPEGAKTGGTVAHVDSPFAETQKWLRGAQKKAQMVELETAYLAEEFPPGGPQKLETFLLVSDNVGTKGESLSEQSSGARKAAQTSVLRFLFERDKAVVPAALDIPQDKLGAKIDDLAPERSLASRFQLLAKAREQSKDISASALKGLVSQEPSFTGDFLEKALLQRGEALEHVSSEAQRRGLEIQAISIPKSFENGSWNPKTDSLPFYLEVRGKADQAKLEGLLDKIYEGNEEERALVLVKQAQGPPPKGFVKVPLSDASRELDRRFFQFRLGQTALKDAGLVPTFTRGGKFKQTPVYLSGDRCQEYFIHLQEQPPK